MLTNYAVGRAASTIADALDPVGRVGALAARITSLSTGDQTRTIMAASDCLFAGMPPVETLFPVIVFATANMKIASGEPIGVPLPFHTSLA